MHPPAATRIPLTVDPFSPVPLYHQLSLQFLAAIELGLLNPGDIIEPEVALAERLGIARRVLRRALVDLAERGILTRAPGFGTTVTDGPTGHPSAAARAA